MLFTVGFITIYSIYGKWWKTSIGRHMVGFMGGCAVLFFLAILVRVFPELSGNTQLRFWSWNAVIALFAWRFVVALQVWILKNQGDLQKMEEEEEVEPVPEYVFDILHSWSTGEPLNFKGHKVPKVVQNYLETDLAK